VLSKISEEADWQEGDGRRFEAVGQIDARRGSYGGCRDPQAYSHHHEWYVQRISYRTPILNAHAFLRWQRNEASGPTTSPQYGRREMFVITPVVSN
jgi:hypothetical protein